MNNRIFRNHKCLRHTRRIRKTPRLYRRILCNVYTFHVKSSTSRRKRPRPLRYFRYAFSRIRANIIRNVVFYTWMVVIFTGIRVECPCCRRLIFGVEATSRHFRLACDLFQRLIVNKYLFWECCCTFFCWVAIHCTDVAKISIPPLSFPEVSFFRPNRAAHDITAFEPDFSVRCSLQRYVCFVDRKMRFTVNSRFRDYCTAV